MKIPKKLNICGLTFDVDLRKDLMGSSFDCVKQKITLGAKDLTKEELLDDFVHEVIEVILVERGHRYSSYLDFQDTEGTLFIFSHKDYGNVARDISFVLRQIFWSKLKF